MVHLDMKGPHRANGEANETIANAALASTKLRNSNPQASGQARPPAPSTIRLIKPRAKRAEILALKKGILANFDPAGSGSLLERLRAARDRHLLETLVSPELRGRTERIITELRRAELRRDCALTLAAEERARDALTGQRAHLVRILRSFVAGGGDGGQANGHAAAH
jgi:hypothetical protein